MTKITNIAAIITKLLALLLLAYTIVIVVTSTEFIGFSLVGATVDGINAGSWFSSTYMLGCLILMILFNFFLSFRTKSWQPAKVNLFALVAFLLYFITYTW